MPATKDFPPSSPAPVSTSKILIFSGLVLFVVFASACVTIRRRQNRQTIAPLHAPSPPPSTARNRPLHHDVHFEKTAGTPTWCSIQPLAVQTPFRQPRPRPPQDGEGRWPTIKRPGIQPSPSSRSDTSIDTLLDFEMFPVDDFDRHLHIAILIAMPLPPGSDTLSRDAAADGNMAIGVADTLFPTP
ncbi:hypothetical protein B0H19DRAFT_319678 [Mycena capillaripes]|nr:hypothetical protein B0H19DRAFT_319678 [Mycena capillaripes]